MLVVSVVNYTKKTLMLYTYTFFFNSTNKSHWCIKRKALMFGHLRKIKCYYMISFSLSFFGTVAFSKAPARILLFKNIFIKINFHLQQESFTVLLKTCDWLMYKWSIQIYRLKTDPLSAKFLFPQFFYTTIYPGFSA